MSTHHPPSHLKQKRFRYSAILTTVTMATTLCLTSLPAQASSNNPEHSSVTGTYQIISARPAPDGTTPEHEHIHLIETNSNELIQIHVEDESQLEGLTPGAEISVTGTETTGVSGDGIQVEQLTVPKNQEIADSPSSGALRTAVILLKKGDTGTTPITTAQARGFYFTNPDSANNYFKESSWNSLSLIGSANAIGDVYDYLTIPSTTNCYGEVTAGNNAASAAGIKLDQYDLVSYVLDLNAASGCGYGGYAFVGGKDHINLYSANNTTYFKGTINHEIGHNLGLNHAKSLSCQTATSIVTFPGENVNCTSAAYGDSYDNMGSGSRFHYNAQYKHQLGWIPNSKVTEITSSGEYALAPHTNNTATAPQLLKLKLGNPAEDYVIDYRQAHGQHWETRFNHLNASLDEASLNGAMIRRVTASGTEVVRANPYTNGPGGFPLTLSSGVLNDPASGTKIQLLSAGANATVKITLGGPIYTSNHPQVYLRGTHNAWGTTTQMTLVANNLWETKINFTGNPNERFKFDINGDWSNNYGDNNNDKIADSNGADIPITQGAGEYTITWNDQSRAYTIFKTPIPNQSPVPVIKQGASVTVPAGIPITLDGSESYDPDGTIESYEWSFFGERGSSSKWTTIFDTPGNFTVNFIVEDNNGARASANITVLVTNPTTFTSTNPQVYLRGTHNSWGLTTPMRLVSSYVWWSKVEFTSAPNQRFKFDINGDWSNNYGDNNNDKIADSNGADIPITQGPGTYIITWNELSRAYTITKE